MHRLMLDKDFFIRVSMKQPFLTKEKEFELARNWRDHHDEKSLHALIRAYARLSISVARRYKCYNLALSDLSQEGMIGLMKAAERFDPERNVRFSTYATWWIRSMIQEYLLRNWSLVRTGTTSSQKKLFFNLSRLRNKIKQNDGALTDEEERKISETLGVSVKDVRYMDARLNKTDQSLNAPVKEDCLSERQDFLSDSRPTPEEGAIDKEIAGREHDFLVQALGTLNEREQKVIYDRYLSESPKVTLEALGHYFHLSKERIRQIEQSALEKLHDNLEGDVRES